MHTQTYICITVLYLCISIYVYIYIYIFRYICKNMYIFMSAITYLLPYTHIHVCIYKRVLTYIYI